jgi:hypothetical protein
MPLIARAEFLAAFDAQGYTAVGRMQDSLLWQGVEGGMAVGSQHDPVDGHGRRH